MDEARLMDAARRAIRSSGISFFRKSVLMHSIVAYDTMNKQLISIHMSIFQLLRQENPKANITELFRSTYFESLAPKIARLSNDEQLELATSLVLDELPTTPKVKEIVDKLKKQTIKYFEEKVKQKNPLYGKEFSEPISKSSLIDSAEAILYFARNEKQNPKNGIQTKIKMLERAREEEAKQTIRKELQKTQKGLVNNVNVLTKAAKNDKQKESSGFTTNMQSVATMCQALALSILGLAVIYLLYNLVGLLKAGGSGINYMFSGLWNVTQMVVGNIPAADAFVQGIVTNATTTLANGAVKVGTGLAAGAVVAGNFVAKGPPGTKRYKVNQILKSFNPQTEYQFRESLKGYETIHIDNIIVTEQLKDIEDLNLNPSTGLASWWDVPEKVKMGDLVERLSKVYQNRAKCVMFTTCLLPFHNLKNIPREALLIQNDFNEANDRLSLIQQFVISTNDGTVTASSSLFDIKQMLSLLRYNMGGKKLSMTNLVEFFAEPLRKIAQNHNILTVLSESNQALHSNAKMILILAKLAEESNDTPSIYGANNNSKLMMSWKNPLNIQESDKDRYVTMKLNNSSISVAISNYDEISAAEAIDYMLQVTQR